MPKRPKKPRRRTQIPARPSHLGPNAAAPTPRDLPRIRACMLEWAEDRSRFGATAWLETISAAIAAASTQPERGKPFGADIAERWARVLRTGELFYVAEALSTLTRHAAESLTGYNLHAQDMPAETGVMFYADPLRDSGAPDPAGLPISLITWGPTGNSILIDFWTATSYRRPAASPIGFPIPGFAHLLNDARHKLPGHLVPPHPLPVHGFLYQRSVAIPFGGPVDVDHVGDRAHGEHACTGEECQTCYAADLTRDTARLQKLIVATWLLMGQPLTLTTPVAPKPLGTGGTRKQRPDPPEDAVRYIELRAVKRPPTEQPDEHNAPGRVYRHSWVVRGHWRRQWYASRGEHRPLWIAPHLAGPEDAPLIGGDRVNVLRR